MERFAAIFLFVLFASALSFAVSSQAWDPEDIGELPCVLCCGAAILPLIAIAFIFNEEKQGTMP